jgi:hypothetical protein
MYAVWSHGGQPVSWRFVVYKSYRYWDGNPWEVYYRSPLQTNTATATQAADFTKMSVGITPPDLAPRISNSYRVEVRMLWWYPDDPVMLLHSKIRYLLPNMARYFDGVRESGLVMPCSYRAPNPFL